MAYTAEVDQQNDGTGQGDQTHQQIPTALADVVHTANGNGNAGNQHDQAQQTADHGDDGQNQGQQGVEQVAPPVFASGRTALEVQGVQAEELDGLDKVNRLGTLQVVGTGLHLGKEILDLVSESVAGLGAVKGVAAVGAELSAFAHGLAALGTEHNDSSLFLLVIP